MRRVEIYEKMVISREFERDRNLEVRIIELEDPGKYAVRLRWADMMGGDIWLASGDVKKLCDVVERGIDGIKAAHGPQN